MKIPLYNLTMVSLLCMINHAAAEVIYSNLKNISIPNTFDGVFVDVDGGHEQSTTTFTGWDINPFIGGKYLANSAAFQPARNGVDGIDSVLKFSTGDTIDSGLNYAVGRGGSLDHLGNAVDQFQSNIEGYLGFKLNDNYGWMRVVLGGATPVIRDWAYDNSGAAIVVGGLQQAAAVDGVQAVTLTLGAASALADTGGNISRLVKTGDATTTLTGTNTYSGTTTVSGGKLLVNGSITGAGAVSVASGATLGGSGTIAGAVTVNGGILSPGASIESLTTGALTLNTGSTFVYEMDSSAHSSVAADFQKVTGTLTLSGSVNLTLSDVADSPTAFAPNTTLSLINYAGVWNHGYFTYAGNQLTDGEVFTAGLNTWQIRYGATTGGLNFATEYTPPSGSFVNLTAVPEPGSLLVLGCLIGSGALLRMRRLC